MQYLHDSPSSDREGSKPAMDRLNKLSTENITIRKFVSDGVILVAFIVIIVATVITNAIVFLSFLAKKHTKSVTFIFIVSLSVALTLTGCVVSAFAMKHTLYPNPDSSQLECEIPVYIELACVASAIFSHLAVGIDRYVAVVCPGKRRIDVRTAGAMVAAIWTLSILYSLRLIIQFNHSRAEARAHTQKFCNLFVQEKEENFIFRSLDFSFLFILPLIALTYMYSMVGIRLWGSRFISSHIHHTRQKRRVITFLAVSLLLFFLCWCPFYILDMAGDFKKMINPADKTSDTPLYIKLRFTFVLMAFANCFATPLAYILFFPAIRQETMVAIRRMLHMNTAEDTSPVIKRVATVLFRRPTTVAPAVRNNSACPSLAKNMPATVESEWHSEDTCFGRSFVLKDSAEKHPQGHKSTAKVFFPPSKISSESSDVSLPGKDN